MDYGSNITNNEAKVSLTKATVSKEFNTIEELKREAWKLYTNEQELPAAERKERRDIIKVIGDLVGTGFALFKDGPALEHIKQLHERIDKIQSGPRD